MCLASFRGASLSRITRAARRVPFCRAGPWDLHWFRVEDAMDPKEAGRTELFICLLSLFWPRRRTGLAGIASKQEEKSLRDEAFYS